MGEKKMKFHHDYICEPNHIRIIAESVNSAAKGIKINFLVNDKVALSLAHTLQSYAPTKDDIDDHVIRCCKFIKATSESYIQDRFEEENIMRILNVHRFINKVRTRTGRVIWSV